MVDIPQERLDDLIFRSENNGYSPADLKRQKQNGKNIPEVGAGVIVTAHELKQLLDARNDNA